MPERALQQLPQHASRMHERALPQIGCAATLQKVKDLRALRAYEHPSSVQPRMMATLNLARTGGCLNVPQIGCAATLQKVKDLLSSDKHPSSGNRRDNSIPYYILSNVPQRTMQGCLNASEARLNARVPQRNARVPQRV